MLDKLKKLVYTRTHGSHYSPEEKLKLVVTTLGMSDDEQRLESLEGMQGLTLCQSHNFLFL